MRRTTVAVAVVMMMGAAGLCMRGKGRLWVSLSHQSPCFLWLSDLGRAEQKQNDAVPYRLL